MKNLKLQNQSYEDWQFFEAARVFNVFEAAEAGKINPEFLAKAWFTFSKAMPSLLSMMAKRLSSIDMKSTFLSILDEEQGSGVNENAHYNLFRNSCLKVGLPCSEVHLNSLSRLSQIIEETKTDAKILGISLGLEIIANENIEELFRQITRDNNSHYRNLLNGDDFFEIHFENEDEHIEKNLNNYFQYVGLSTENEYLIGFYNSLQFWKDFWSEVNYV